MEQRTDEEKARSLFTGAACQMYTQTVLELVGYTSAGFYFDKIDKILKIDLLCKTLNGNRRIIDVKSSFDYGDSVSIPLNSAFLDVKAENLGTSCWFALTFRDIPEIAIVWADYAFLDFLNGTCRKKTCWAIKYNELKTAPGLKIEWISTENATPGQICQKHYGEFFSENHALKPNTDPIWIGVKNKLISGELVQDMRTKFGNDLSLICRPT